MASLGHSCRTIRSGHHTEPLDTSNPGGHVPVLGNIVGPELLVVLAIALVLFGGGRLPALARSLGAARSELERALRDDDPGPTGR
jgi:sec-independent protein translocase protein TatA